jgi:hypothetical protein
MDEFPAWKHAKKSFLDGFKSLWGLLGLLTLLCGFSSVILLFAKKKEDRHEYTPVLFTPEKNFLVKAPTCAIL